jgi:hypothetical protein
LADKFGKQSIPPGVVVGFADVKKNHKEGCSWHEVNDEEEDEVT